MAIFYLDFMSAKTGLNDVECGLKPPKRRRREMFEMLPQPEFIVGGADAQDEQHPWHASISTNYGDDDFERYDFCGATLISRRAVLTGILYKAPPLSIFISFYF